MKISPLAWVFGTLADCEELGAVLITIGIVGALVGLATYVAHR